MKNIVPFSKYHLKESIEWKNIVDKAKSSDSSFHQEILNYAYDGFNAENPNNFSFPGLIEWTEKHMGKEFALLVFLGKYNQQVTNGGHLQYHDNGYDGSEGDKDEDTPLHDDMRHMFKQLGYDKLPLGDKILDIMNKYTVQLWAEDCDSCGGSGYEEDEDGYGTFSCGECGGSGESRHDYRMHVDEELDTEYYKYDDAWMETLEAKAKELSVKELAKLDNPDITDDELKDTLHMFL